MSQFEVQLNHLRIAPRKVRLVADSIRGMPVQQALDQLLFSRGASAKKIGKLIRSAVANADKKGGVNLDLLVVRTITVDQGPTLRRFMTRARGSASRINKKTSHITVMLEEK